MKEKLRQLLILAQQKQATDLHFTIIGRQVRVSFRGLYGMEEVESAMFDEALFNYLKYIAHLDLGNTLKPQSGNFGFSLDGKDLFFRFSLIVTQGLQTGVLRILNNHARIELAHITNQEVQRQSFYAWCQRTSGMVILSGPTGSGKTTTLHALLAHIADIGKHHIITLEDPIEIHDERYIQLQINEASGFTYDEGIRQLMRHDPDVIMLGEIRDEATAKSAYRCALSGHMVFSTVHAKSASEAIKRLEELGLKRSELQDTLTAVCAQRLYPHKQKEGERLCIYEILEKDDLYTVLQGKAIPKHKDIFKELEEAKQLGLIEISEFSTT